MGNVDMEVGDDDEMVEDVEVDDQEEEDVFVGKEALKGEEEVVKNVEKDVDKKEEVE